MSRYVTFQRLSQRSTVKGPFPPSEAAGFGRFSHFPVVLGLGPLGPSSATGQREALNLSASVNIPVSPHWTLEQHGAGISSNLNELDRSDRLSSSGHIWMQRQKHASISIHFFNPNVKSDGCVKGI